MKNFVLPLNRTAIMDLIPHRDPFLLIDEVIEVDPGVSAVAKKHLFTSDWYFKGHFPSYPVMPGVLIMESLAQTAAVCAVLSSTDEFRNRPVYFVAIDEAKFRKPVLPESTFFTHVEVQKVVRGVWFFLCDAKVDGATVADGVIRATIS